MQRLKIILATIVATAAVATAAAQSTLGVTGGWGMTTSRLYPAQETKSIWGVYTGGVSWRYYAPTRFVGAIGVDLEFMQRGFSFSPDAYLYEDKKDYHYYTRKVNSITMPLVWQPHAYLFKNHLRVYIEAALTFTYNINATYDNELTGVSGKYDFYLPRDNRLEYGLAGGGGIDILIGQVEFGFRARYYFGLSDIMRNRNKYYDNGLDDQNANPFSLTPLRSPVDNLMISFKVAFRFNREGFREWTVKRPKRDKNKETFKFSLD